MESPQAIASAADQSAGSRQAASSRADGPVYPATFGPVETTGGHGNAYLTRSPSGVDYIEYVPAGTGRRHKVPLTTVTAIFPTVTRAPRASKSAGKSAKK